MNRRLAGVLAGLTLLWWLGCTGCGSIQSDGYAGEEPDWEEVRSVPAGEEGGLLSSSPESSWNRQEETEMKLEIRVGDTVFEGYLYQNPAAQALWERLPLTLSMSELNGNEKYIYLSSPLPADPSRPEGIRAGDLMLFGSDCLVLFYESFSTSYSYTPLGRMENPNQLAQALGGGSVTLQLAPAE